MDTNAIIQSLMTLKQVPISMMESNKDDYESKISKFDTFKSYLESFQSSADALKDTSDFNVFTASSTDENKLTGSASSTATPGSYNIEISSLATFESEASKNFAAKDTSDFGTGTLTITVNETDTDVTIDSENNTLEGIAEAINETDAEVTATVINDGTGTPYRLVITGDNTGSDETITLDETGLTGGSDTLDFTQLQAASNSEFTINGLEMERATNSVNDAASGLTFELKDTTAINDPVVLTVAQDTSAIKEKIESFASNYNTLINFINEQNTYNETTETGGVLMGESLLRMVQSSVQSILTPSWDTGGDAPEIQILAQLGITFEDDGTLTVNSAELETAINENFEDVKGMFSDSGLADQIDTLLEGYTKFQGMCDSKNEHLEDIVDDLEDQIARAEDQLDNYEASLIKKFAALESTMSILQSQQSFLYNQQIQSYS